MTPLLASSPTIPITRASDGRVVMRLRDVLGPAPLDGAENLVEIATRLERQAIVLRNLSNHGWRLQGPVTDGDAVVEAIEAAVEGEAAAQD